MNNLKVAGVVISVFVLMGVSYFVGSLSSENKMLKQQLLNPNTNLANGPQGPGNDINAIPQISYADMAPIDTDDHIYGNPEAKLALVEYSDFECPYCKSFHPNAKKLVDDSNGEVMWIYRHYPLTNIHPNAMISAIGTECVAKMAGGDAFWSYGEKLMLASEINRDLVISTAVEMGIDEDSFTECLVDPAMNDLVNKDIQEGDAVGISGTPGNIIVNLETGDAQMYPGALPITNLKQAVDAIK